MVPLKYIEGTVLPQMNLEDHHTENNKIFLCRMYFEYVNIVQWTENQYLYQGKQSNLRISTTTEQQITTAH